MTLGWKGPYFTIVRGNKSCGQSEPVSQLLFYKHMYFFILHSPNRKSSNFFFFPKVGKWGYGPLVEFSFAELISKEI